MNRNIRLCAYTAIHLLVDCACMFFVMALISPRIGDGQTALLMLVVYNASAFALPAFFGILSDIIDRNHWIAAVGCLLVAAGYLLRMQPVAMAACIGIGNGLYHVGSGRQVLQDTPHKYAPCGIFIAFGALGLYILQQGNPELFSTVIVTAQDIPKDTQVPAGTASTLTFTDSMAKD